MRDVLCGAMGLVLMAVASGICAQVPPEMLADTTTQCFGPFYEAFPRTDVPHSGYYGMRGRICGDDVRSVHSWLNALGLPCDTVQSVWRDSPRRSGLERITCLNGPQRTPVTYNSNNGTITGPQGVVTQNGGSLSSAAPPADTPKADNASFLSAITEAGYHCESVSNARKSADYDGWRVTCGKDSYAVVNVGGKWMVDRD